MITQAMYNEGIEVLTQTINRLEREVSSGRERSLSDLAQVYANRGSCYLDVSTTYNANKYREAISDLSKSVEIFTRLKKDGKSIDENELAKAYGQRGIAYEAIHELNKALPDMQSGMMIWDRLKRAGKPIDERILDNICFILGKHQ